MIQQPTAMPSGPGKEGDKGLICSRKLTAILVEQSTKVLLNS